MINKNTTKIVVPYDFSEIAGFAIEQAAIIANKTKGEIIIAFIQKNNVTSDIIFPSINIEKPNDVSEFLSEKLTNEAKNIEIKYNLKVTPVFSTGNITTEIIEICNKLDANLIVMGTQGNDSDYDMFLGSFAYQTLTKSNLPIIILRTEPTKNGFSNILLPIDLSIYSMRKLNTAKQLAKLFNSHIHVLGLFDDTDNTDNKKFNNYIEEIEKDCLENNILVTTLITKTDNKVKSIVTYSKNINADIIIEMTDLGTEFESSVLGNYIHQLINNSTVPVLCIKPELIEDNIVKEINGVKYSSTI